MTPSRPIAGPPRSAADRVAQPDVGLDVAADVGGAVDLQRGQPAVDDDAAEFWLKRAKRLEKSGEFRIVVPDEKLDGLKSWLTLDGTAGFLHPLDTLVDPRPLALERRRLRLGTELRATVPEWGVSLRPVVTDTSNGPATVMRSNAPTW